MGKPITQRTKEQKKILAKYAKDNGLPENIYEDFTVYAQYMVPSWNATDKLPWEWFHYHICKYYQDLLDGTTTYLTLETPPQHGKSVLTALFITYIFGNNPDKSIMYFTYDETAAIKFTKQYIFGFMGSDKYKKIFPCVILKNELNNLNKTESTSKLSMRKKESTLRDNEFNIIDPSLKEKYHGRYVAFGLGQGSHGRAGDIMIVDDYISNGRAAKSETVRENLAMAFDVDIISRFQASTILMVICTRWYERDMVGLLNERIQYVIDDFRKYAGKDEIIPTLKSVKIRAEYRISDDNPIEDPRTIDGQILWVPMRTKYSMAKHGEFQEFYQAMYNCDTSDVESIKQLTEQDFGYYYPEDMPKFGGRIYIIMDGASTVRSNSDHTAIGKYKVFGKKRYLMKLWYFKKTIPQLERFMEDLLTGECSDYNECIIEFANSGVAVYQSLQEKGIKCKAIGFNGKIIDDNNKHISSKKDITSKCNSKMDRYIRHMPEYSYTDKRIFLPYNAIQHQDEFINQLTKFTGEDGKRDDFVDIHTYLVNLTSQNIIVTSSTNFSTNKNNSTQNGIMRYNMQNTNYFMKR